MHSVKINKHTEPDRYDMYDVNEYQHKHVFLIFNCRVSKFYPVKASLKMFFCIKNMRKKLLISFNNKYYSYLQNLKTLIKQVY